MPIRILMVQPLEDGGIAHYSHNLLRALCREGLGVVLYTSKNYEFGGMDDSFKIYPNMFRLAGKIAERFPWLSGETSLPSFIRRAIKLLEYPFNIVESLLVAKRNRINVIHFQTVNLTELMMIAIYKIVGAKVIYTIHNVRPRHGRLKDYHIAVYKLTYSLCDHIIIHSESGHNEVAELFNVDPGKISIIPHGDYKFFVPEEKVSKEEAKAALGIPKQSKTILFFGAIRPNKGLDNILKAMPMVRSAVADIKLLIVGEPYEDYERYRKIIKEENITDTIYERLEYVHNCEVSLYFFASDIVVLPYNEITQSGVLQIAYAFGKPVVATAVGGFKEAIEDARNGFLVPLHNEEVLAEKVVEIFQSESRMESMGKFSLSLSDNKYSWDLIAKKTAGIYRKVLEPRKKRNT